jgi:putative hemolysin
MPVPPTARASLGVAIAIALTVVACTHTSEAPPDRAASGDASVASDARAVVVDPSCPTQGGQREDILQGECATGADCPLPQRGQRPPVAAVAVRAGGADAILLHAPWLLPLGG